MPASCAALLLAVLVQQDPTAPFVQRTTAGAALPVVSADRKAISCQDALESLGACMNWNVQFESRPLQADLSGTTVDLYFADQDPRVVGSTPENSGPTASRTGSLNTTQ